MCGRCACDGGECVCVCVYVMVGSVCVCACDGGECVCVCACDGGECVCACDGGECVCVCMCVHVCTCYVSAKHQSIVGLEVY